MPFSSVLFHRRVERLVYWRGKRAIHLPDIYSCLYYADIAPFPFIICRRWAREAGDDIDFAWYYFKSLIGTLHFMLPDAALCRITVALTSRQRASRPLASSRSCRRFQNLSGPRHAFAAHYYTSPAHTAGHSTRGSLSSRYFIMLDFIGFLSLLFRRH